VKYRCDPNVRTCSLSCCLVVEIVAAAVVLLKPLRMIRDWRMYEFILCLQVEPPKLLMQETSDVWIFRGDVKKLDEDKEKLKELQSKL